MTAKTETYTFVTSTGEVGPESPPKTIVAEDEFVTTDPCAAAAYMEANALHERDPVLFRTVTGRCKARSSGPTPGPPKPKTTETPPVGTGDGPGPTPDTPEAQGARRVEVDRVLVDVGPKLYEDVKAGLQPTDLVHDQQDPIPPEVLLDEAYGDVGPEEGAEFIDRWLRGLPEQGERDPARSGEASHQPVSGGDPVDLFRGVLRMSIMDLDVPTPVLPLRLARTYESGRPRFGPWGFNWDHNYNQYVRELADGGVAHWTGEMRERVFTLKDDALQPERGVHARLERVPGVPQAYRLTERHGLAFHFERPPAWSDPERIPLIAVRDRHGNEQSLIYDGENRLASVVDGDGRGLAFTYGTCGLLEAVRDHSGKRSLSYDHDADAEHLAAVTTAATASFPEGASTLYDYDLAAGHPAMRHNLVRVTSPDGETWLENEYGGPETGWAFNRVTRQLSDGWLYEYSYEQLQYVPEDPAYVDVIAFRTTIRLPDGTLHTYTFNYRGDLIDQRFRLVSDGSYRVVSRTWRYDEQGNLVEAVEPDGSRTVFTFDTFNPDPCGRGNLLKAECFAAPGFPVASRVLFEGSYEPEHQLPREVTAENHAATRFVYDFDIAPGPLASGRLAAVEWPDAELPDGTVQTAVTRVEVAASGEVEALVDPEGSRMELRRLPHGTPLGGFVAEIAADVGEVDAVTQLEYDDRGFVSKIVDPGGAETELVVDTLGQPEEIRLPDISDEPPATVRLRYDGLGIVRSVDHPRGEYVDAVVVGDWLRDAVETTPTGQVRRVVRGANTERPRATTFCLDFEGRVVKETAPDGTVTRRWWDERGLLLREVRAAGTAAEVETRFVYDRAGRLVRRTDPGGGVTVYHLDPWGRVGSVEQPNGSLLRFEWGALDLLAAQTVEGDPGDGGPPRELQRITYAYDSRGRPVEQQLFAFSDDPNATVALPIRRWFDRADRLVRRESPRGAAWIYEYDGLGRLLSAADAVGNATTWSYTPAGLLASMTTADVEAGTTRVRTVMFEYDERGRCVEERTPEGQVRSRRFDARDLPVEERDEDTVVTRSSFGLLGELVTTVFDPDGLGLSAVRDHDLEGRLVRAEDPTGESLEVERDPLGRIGVLRLADGAEWRWTYTPGGEVATITAPSSCTVSHLYDGAGRVVQLTATAVPGRTPVAAHHYRYDGLDRLVEAGAGGETVVRAWDSLGRLLKDSASGREFLAAYDDESGSLELRFPEGRREQHAFDLLGRPDRVELLDPGSSPVAGLAGAAGAHLVDVEYGGPVRVSEIGYANGVRSVWRHDDAGRLGRVRRLGPGGEVLDATQYYHHRTNRRGLVHRVDLAPHSTLHRYDARGRLVGSAEGLELGPVSEATTQAEQDAAIAAATAAVDTAATATSFDLDGGDTRVAAAVIEAGVTSSIPYGTAPGHRTVAVGAETVAYDTDGHRVSDGMLSYEYDALGRCVVIRDAITQAPLAEFVHDPLGRLHRGALLGETYARGFFGEEWLEQRDGAGSVTIERTALPPLAVPGLETRAAGVLHLHVDGHLNLVLVTDADGAPVTRYRYESFGLPTAFEADGTPLPTAELAPVRPRFGGMELVSGTARYHTPTRIYDPRTGVFASPDRWLCWTSPSPYALAAHDPVNAPDPRGELAPLVVAGLVVGGVGLIVGGVGRWLFDPGADKLDIAVTAAAGGVAGFVSAVTFGYAAASLGTLAGGGAAGASTTWGFALLRGFVAGEISGGLGAASGALGQGLYEGYRRGDAATDPWPAALRAADEAAIAGAVEGGVTGPMYVTSLRLGVIRPGRPFVAERGTWAGIRSGRGVTAEMLVRGAASPYGAGGAVTGFVGGLAGSAVRRELRGESLASQEVLEDAYQAGVLSVLGSAVAHPTSWRYWANRLSPRFARRTEALRRSMVGVHHDLNVAQHPEFVTSPWNLRPYSSRAEHISFHEMWRTPELGRRNWSQIPTFGPAAPPWRLQYLMPEPGSARELTLKP